MNKNDMFVAVGKAMSKADYVKEKCDNDSRLLDIIYGKNADYSIRRENNTYVVTAISKEDGEEFDIGEFNLSPLSRLTIGKEITACVEIIEEDDIWND